MGNFFNLLVKDDEQFMEAVKYNKNMIEMDTLLKKINDEGIEIKVLSGFDANSDDEYVSTFRRCEIEISSPTDYYKIKSILDDEDYYHYYSQNDNSLLITI